MNTAESKPVISSLWFQVSVLTFLIGFAVLGYLAYKINAQHPPIPNAVQTVKGETVFTGENIMAGQNLFQKYGLMQLGTIFGHGAYLGPDFTAQYLHRQSTMLEFYKSKQIDEPGARAMVAGELKEKPL